jgi:phenylalanyl-tRNA synthetase alpha subunit
VRRSGANNSGEYQTFLGVGYLTPQQTDDVSADVFSVRRRKDEEEEMTKKKKKKRKEKEEEKTNKRKKKKRKEEEEENKKKKKKKEEKKKKKKKQKVRPNSPHPVFFPLQGQFCLAFLHSFQLLFHDCGFPRFTLFFTLPNAIFFYYLFSNFYFKSYNGKVKELKQS